MAYVDRCRFEQALRDPVDAQLDAALDVLAEYTRLPYRADGKGVDAAPAPAAIVMLNDAEEARRRNREAMRRILLAAAAVVLDREPCSACGRPLGTGSLLDFKPVPPSVDEPKPPGVPALALSSAFGEGAIPLEMWREFAARCRCPACAEAVPGGG